MTTPNHHPDPSLDSEHPGPRLDPRDVAALDALMDAGPGAQVAGSAADKARVERLMNLLSLAGSAEVAKDPALIDATVLRVAREVAASRREPELTVLDQDAVDALVQAGMDVHKTPSALRDRAEKCHGLMAMAGSGDVGGREARIDRLMAEVERREAPAPIPLSRGAWLGWARGRLADVASVAAVLIVGVSLLFPVMSSVRDQSRRAACLGNFNAVASALSRYAGDNRDELPTYAANFGNGSWMEVGKEPAHSNSANLFTLARMGYAKLRDLACSGNPNACRSEQCLPGAMDWKCSDEVSYSYQVMAGQRPRWSDPSGAAVLGDRSPVVVRALRGETIDPMENSLNHGRSGQNVLFSDGSARFLSTPMRTPEDNIWFPTLKIRVTFSPQGVTLSGYERPAAPDDAFLAP